MRGMGFMGGFEEGRQPDTEFWGFDVSFREPIVDFSFYCACGQSEFFTSKPPRGQLTHKCSGCGTDWAIVWDPTPSPEPMVSFSESKGSFDLPPPPGTSTEGKALRSVPSVRGRKLPPLRPKGLPPPPPI